MSTILSLQNISKHMQGRRILNAVNLEVNEGQTICIMGSSGAGKTTLLRCINLLEKPDKDAQSKIIFDGTDILSFAHGRESRFHKKISEVRSKIGMVFQSFNLWPHMSVIGNICRPLRCVKKYTRDESYEIALKYLDQVGMRAKKDQYPHALSGGQKQRVAIARSLALNPKIILFDEPTSALDPQLTKEVSAIIAQLAQQKYTMICVTHNVGFSRQIADEIAVLDHGAVIAHGSPEDVMNKAPENIVRDLFDL